MFYIFSAQSDIVHESTLKWKTINKPVFPFPDEVVGLITHHSLHDIDLDVHAVKTDIFILKKAGSKLYISDFDFIVNVEISEFESRFNNHKDQWVKVAEKTINNTTQKLFITPSKKLVLVPILTQRGSVHIFAQTQSGKYLIVKQFRPGPETILSDIPGGGMEDGEDAQEAGMRELLEETGYIGDVKYLHTCFSGAYHSMLKHTLVVVNCQKIKDLVNDDEENFGVIEVTKAELMEIVNKGDITGSDFATIMYGLIKLG